MPDWGTMTKSPWEIRVLETPEEIAAVEELQRLVWPGSDLDVTPAHVLLTAAHNGGLVVGAWVDEQLIGFVFGFLGLDARTAPPRLKHCSHMLGVHPDWRDAGVGFALKRAQWQLVRYQGIELITWTYDPLLGRNAHLNIHKLGAVCDTYLENLYGAMRDSSNAGLPSDRFQVDWWVGSRRVAQRLSRDAPPPPSFADYAAAEVPILNPARFGDDGWPRPGEAVTDLPESADRCFVTALVEIPADFTALKSVDSALALAWRLHTRALWQDLFARGFLVVNFVHTPGPPARSFYVVYRSQCGSAP